MKKKRFQCQCCGFFTLVGKDELDVLWDICPVCFWEYDVARGASLETYSHANRMMLGQGRKNFQMFHACDKESVDSVRAPKPEELPENNQT